MSFTRARIDEESSLSKKPAEEQRIELEDGSCQVTIRPQRVTQLAKHRADHTVPLIGRVGGSDLSKRHWRVPALVKRSE